MKIVALLILIFFARHTHADCQDEWITHRSSTLYLSVSYSEGCYAGELTLNFSRFPKSGPSWPDPSLKLTSIPFVRECTVKEKNEEGETIEFSCRKDGVSPLAGATYRFKLVETTFRCEGKVEKGWNHTFLCTSGCQPTTPKTLEVLHGEGCA
jgi:hypothetical protein